MEVNKAIFLDRDGVLNVDYGYVHKIEDLKLINGAKECLHKFKELGYLLVVITNQSGIGRGYYTVEDCEVFNKTMEKYLDITFDAIYICPHVDYDDCNCRKPNIGNLLKARKQLGIDFRKSYFIGDRESDILCGKNAGCKTIYFHCDKYEDKAFGADFVVDSYQDMFTKVKF